jgi:hypothetical protein
MTAIHVNSDNTYINAIEYVDEDTFNQCKTQLEQKDGYTWLWIEDISKYTRGVL